MSTLLRLAQDEVGFCIAISALANAHGYGRVAPSAGIILKNGGLPKAATTFWRLCDTSTRCIKAGHGPMTGRLALKRLEWCVLTRAIYSTSGSILESRIPHHECASQAESANTVLVPPPTASRGAEVWRPSARAALAIPPIRLHTHTPPVRCPCTMLCIYVHTIRSGEQCVLIWIIWLHSAPSLAPCAAIGRLIIAAPHWLLAGPALAALQRWCRSARGFGASRAHCSTLLILQRGCRVDMLGWLLLSRGPATVMSRVGRCHVEQSGCVCAGYPWPRDGLVSGRWPRWLQPSLAWRAADDSSKGSFQRPLQRFNNG